MTAAPAVKALDAIITQLGIEQVLVVGRNAQGFALPRKPVGPMTIVSLHVGTFKSGPQRPDPEEGGVLDPPRRGLPPLRPRIGAIGHAEHDAPLSFANRRYLMLHQRAFEDDERIRGGADPDLPPADPRLKDGMDQAVRRLPAAW
jgi:hypothetical protein